MHATLLPLALLCLAAAEKPAEQAVRAKPKPIPAKGAIIEAIIGDLDDGEGDEAINLDGAQQFDLPDMDGWSHQQRQNWIVANKIDLLADYANNRWALATVNLTLKAIPASKWGTVAFAEVDRVLSRTTPSAQDDIEILERGGVCYHILTRDAKVPVTFAFKTSEGNLGVLQVVEFREKPRGLKIRYRLAPPTQAARPETGSTRGTFLFVRTEPAGAEVLVDGRLVGASDDLFRVEPGVRAIIINLDGHDREDGEVTIHAGRVTRLELKLTKEADSPANPRAALSRKAIVIGSLTPISAANPRAALSRKGASAKTDFKLAQSSGDEAAVRKVISRYVEAIRQHDIRTLATCLANKKYLDADELGRWRDAVSAGLKMDEIREVQVVGNLALVATPFVEVPELGHGEPVCVVYNLTKREAGWTIGDMDVETEEGVAKELSYLRKTASPDAPEVESTKSQLALIERALGAYALDTGDYPATEQGLGALIRQPDGMRNSTSWQGPYVNSTAIPCDAWENPIRYEYTEGGQSPRIWSAGPDGTNGTEDDITVGKTSEGEGTRASFGPVVQCPFTPEIPRMGTFVDLESGKTFQVPEEVKKDGSGKKLIAWAKENRVDINVRVMPGPICYLGSLDSYFWRTDETNWQKTTAGDVLTDRQLQEGELGYGNITKRPDELPAVYMFKTRECNGGLLEIVEFDESSEDAVGVKIRFKLVRIP